MSYDLDETFAQRGAGELVKEEVVRSRVIRTPGLRVVEQAELYRPLDHGRPYKNLHSTLGKAASDMAGFLDDEFTIFGQTVTVKHVAVGGVLAAAAWYLFFRKHKRA